MGTVIVRGIIVDGVVVVVEIPAVDIIGIAIAVIVDAVSGDFERVDPDVRCEIGMIQLNPGVNYSDVQSPVADESVAPCLFSGRTELICGATRAG